MPAWSEAQRLSVETRSRYAPHGHDINSTPYLDSVKMKYDLRWLTLHPDERQRTCFFCWGRGQHLTTGNLSGIGTMMKCDKCKTAYDALRKNIEEANRE